MKIHELKIHLKYYKDILSGTKRFEWRKNDRDFQVGDIIQFRILGKTLFGREHSILGNDLFQITYVLKDVPELGLPEGYCVLSIKQLFIPDVRHWYPKIILNSAYGKMMSDFIKKDCEIPEVKSDDDTK